MTSYRFRQIDVFTDAPLTGNPLAVFPDGEGLSDDQMQAIAREMNLSETTFVLPSKEATRRVRIFTPQRELPLAGHPTIGTWWTLAELGQVDLPERGVVRVTQETGAGILPVDLYSENSSLREVVMVQTLPEFGESIDDIDGLARALGGEPGLVLKEPVVQVVSTALPQVMIPVRSLAALQALPSGGTGSELASFLRRVSSDCAMCYTEETESPEATVHCRMFAPGVGVPEDPATGSASGALGSYLVWHGIVRPHDGVADIVVEQGIEIARPSRIHVEIAVGNGGEITEVRVGGTAVTLIEGEVSL